MWWPFTQSFGLSRNFLYSVSLSRTMANSGSLSLTRGNLAISRLSVIFQGGGIRFLAVILYWSLFGVPSWARMDMLIGRENPTASLILTHGAPHVVSGFYTVKPRNVDGI